MMRYTSRLCGLSAALLLSSTILLGGCVYSETITEVILNNDPDTQVDPSITPVLINSVDADETTDMLPRLEASDTEVADMMENAKPLYTVDPEKATTEKPAPQPVYAREADSAGETANQARDTEEPVEQDGEQSDEEAEDGVQTTPDESGPDDSSSDAPPSDEPESNGEEGEGEGDGVDDGEGQGGDSDPGEGHKSGGTGTVYTSDVNTEPEIPDNIDEVAAVGNVAVIVSMISGTPEGTSLVACDEATKGAMGNVLKNRGIANVPALWGSDGKEGGLSEEDFTSLVEDAHPDLVYITEGDSTLSEAQMAKLKENSIDVYYLPKLSSAKRIRFAVKVVGMTLAKGGVEGAETAYTAYLDHESALVKKYTGDGYNGGVTGGYDFDAEENASAAPTAIATLYIDKWDTDARNGSDLVDTSKGVAVSTLGYGASPVSHYLSVGGVLNNAASKPFRTLSGSGVVWQFAQNELTYRFGAWSNLDVATYDLCSHVSGGVYISDLLWNTSEVAAGYGTESFPAVVTKSQKLKERMAENSAKNAQLYYPYPVIHPGSGNATTLGFFKTADENGAYVESCIGRMSDGRETEQANQKNCQVFVNPKGLAQQDSDDALCSWTDGSPESMLEASWAYWKFRGGGENEFKQEVIDFYQKFYGYDLSDADYKAIVSGVED